MINKGRDIYTIIFLVLFIIGLYNNKKNLLSYEYKGEQSSTQWKIDKLLEDENEDISNVTTSSTRRRRRDTKKKHKEERSPALDIYIRPVGGMGPNNQVLGLIYIHEFFRYYNLRTTYSVLCPHYTIRGDHPECLPISSLFEVARHPNTFKPVPIINDHQTDFIIGGNGKELKRAGINSTNASIITVPDSDKLTRLTELVKNGTISRGSIVAYGKGIGGQGALFKRKMAPQPFLQSLQNWTFDEPYLPVERIRQQTISKLGSLGLKTGSSGNFIAVHLRLWDACFRKGYSGEYTLNICCCGHKMTELSEAGSSLSKVLGEYISNK